MEAVSGPYLIKLDVFALTTSTTRDDPSLLFPSVPTSFNKIQKILNSQKMEALKNECDDPEIYKKILEQHQLIRLFRKDDDPSEIASGLAIERIISLWCYIIKL